MKYIDNILSAVYNQLTKCIKPDEVKGRSPYPCKGNRWSNLKKEPFFKETFRYQNLLWMGLWKELGFIAKVAVEVMLSGKNTEDIQAETELFYFYYAVYPFFDSGKCSKATTFLFISKRRKKK